MRLVIHIGRHKTGSTAVQEHFGTESHAGLCYPTAGQRPRAPGAFRLNHHGLAFSLEDPDSPMGAGPVEAIVRTIAREADGSSTLLVSSEVLQWSGPRRIAGLRSIAARLGAEETLVVGYVREFHAYVRSAFQEAVSSDGRTHDFLAFARWYADLDLTAFARRFDDLGTVRLRPYERARFPSGDVVRDFHDLIEVPWCGGPDGPADTNPSVGGSLLLLGCLLNHVGGAQPIGRMLLKSVAARHPRFGAPPSIDERTRDRLEVDNRYRTTFAALFPEAGPAASLGGVALHPDLLEEDLPLLRDELRLPPARIRAALAAVGDAARWFHIDGRWP